ncbi:hypothetical protein Afil01_62140 [Actinorhabdospora filicis]|uniref:Uncharacterized protein n=1 Tax=Actinorhabdospora filicis TaxID=1785913 RepID=A0A9W6ST87_9ACTN|nr:DUF5403 family protein [Actinorhabdospora filicis]GLZ81407.1 hypothetical protein Afil01_62140 [Actinorhabdospora filicis]
MPSVFRSINGVQTEKYIAKMRGVQADLRGRAFEIKARAEAILAEHRHDGDAKIEIDKGWVDHYVILNDKRGQYAAKSIEWGRAAGSYIKVVNGEEIEVTYGAMEGLYVLTRASNLPKKKRPKVEVDPRGRPS